MGRKNTKILPISKLVVDFGNLDNFSFLYILETLGMVWELYKRLMK
jgi:hypothetical protein